MLSEGLIATFLEALLAAQEVKPVLRTERLTGVTTLLLGSSSHIPLERVDVLDDGAP
jgi:hypothetical protein